MTYYICVVSPKFPENYQIGIHANKWGVEERYRHRIKPVRPGDIVLFVMGGEFISIHEIESEYYRDNEILWPPKNGDIFPYRINISDAILSGKVPIKDDLQHKISFMEGKGWGGTIQGANGVFNNKLTDDDYQLIKARMEKRIQIRKPIQQSPKTPDKIVTQRQKALFKFYEYEIEERLVFLLDELGLTLYVEPDTGRNGRQFAIDGWRIDLLCLDKETEDFVIIELKKGEAPQETLLQILKYMSSVKQNMAIKLKKNVKGIILTEHADTELKYFLEEVPNVDIRYYKVSISLVGQNET